MSTLRHLPAVAGLALGAILVSTSMAGPVMGAKADRRNQRQERAEPAPPTAAIATVKGTRHRLGQTKVASDLIRIRDAAADQLAPDGGPVSGAPAWTDLSAAYVAPFRFSAKLERTILNRFPRGSAGTFQGPDSDWSVGDRGLFVIVELAERRPDDLISQLVEVGLDGADAGPVQVGSATDTRAGVEVFMLGGRFNNGSESAGTTDVSGRAPGGTIEYYNAPSRVFGAYNARQGAYFMLLPTRQGTRSLAISLRSVTDGGEVIDRLELPGGGHLVPLDDPGLGFKAADDASPLGCRAISTSSVASRSSAGSESSDGPDEDVPTSSEDPAEDPEAATEDPGAEAATGDPGAEAASDDPREAEPSDTTTESALATTTIQYTAGVGRDPETGELLDADATLAALDGLERVPMLLTRLDAEADAVDVDARVTVAPALGSFSLTIDVPPGQWAFAPADGEALVTPSGEPLIDHTTLTGRAGVRTGPGLNGFVSGVADCGRWALDVTACDLVPDEGLEALVPTASGLEQVDITRADGSAWCVGRIPDTQDAKYIVRFGRDYATSAELQDAAEASGCTASPVAIGREGLALDCAAKGSFERYLFLVAPQATALRDPAGGILVSVDMVVDPAQPVGERYDTAAALELMGGIASDLAAAAEPGGPPGPAAG